MGQDNSTDKMTTAIYWHAITSALSTSMLCSISNEGFTIFIFGQD